MDFQTAMMGKFSSARPEGGAAVAKFSFKYSNKVYLEERTVKSIISILSDLGGLLSLTNKVIGLLLSYWYNEWMTFAAIKVLFLSDQSIDSV